VRDIVVYHRDALVVQSPSLSRFPFTVYCLPFMYNCRMQAPSTPIMVKIVEKNEVAGLGQVMLDAIGLTGVIAIGALLFGLVLAAVIIGWRRIRVQLQPDEDVQTQPLGLTPTQPAVKSKI
jgi:hypothetical protein